MNAQCAFCGRLLPNQEPDGSRSLGADEFCSTGCESAQATAVALRSEPAFLEEAEPGDAVPETFDMGQLCPA